MAAYGLYSHIQSNKRRSVALLIGLFFLVYVMVFAGALLAEALSSYYGNNAPIDYLIHAACSISSRHFHSPRSERSSGSQSPTNFTRR